MDFPYMVWAHYVNGPKQDFKLLLLLCDRPGGKVAALDGKRVPQEDADEIRRSLKTLRRLNDEERMTWIRDNIQSWRSTYRELFKDKLSIREEFEITELKV